MNENAIKGNWKQMRGLIKIWWNKLSDDDLKQVNGKKDKLIGMLVDRYGYTQQKAEEEYKKRIT
jgi:uncharacterized protein YjbJ (UPF0337 family)